jgi:lipoprotein NlpD
MTRSGRILMLAAVTGPILLAGCVTSNTTAPVFDRSPNATPTPAPATAKPKPAPAPAPQAATPAKPATAPAATTAAPAPTPAPAETEPVIKPAPAAEPVAVQKIDEPLARPYREGDPRPEFHVVRKGDTLYSIALDYGQDYRDLAAWNNLQDPGVIKIDQRLRLFPPEGVEAAAATAAAETSTQSAMKTEPKGRKLPYSEQALAQLSMPVPTKPPAATTAPEIKPAAAPKPAAPSTPAAAPDDAKLTWEWPAQGRVMYGFGQGTNQKGLGIEGRSGEPVLASAPGKVVYSGSGLRGYGKLVIIKHNATFLSVYAHNSQILVKEGQSVAKGQKIAEVGSTDSDRAGLHFEIRRFGKPMDPLQFLPGRAS